MTDQSMTGDVVPNFSAMLREALGDRLATGLGPDATFRDMFAEDGVTEFPFAPTGLTARLDGRAALAAYLAVLGRQIDFGAMSRPVVRETRDPSVVVLEFTGSGAEPGPGASTSRPISRSSPRARAVSRATATTGTRWSCSTP